MILRESTSPEIHQAKRSVNNGTADRDAVLVLGMHRSGTSALSEVMIRLGAPSPASPMPATPENPRGFGESMAVLRFNQRALGMVHSDWADWLAVPEAWFASQAAIRHAGRIPGLIESEFVDCSQLLAVKDPRICRLLPLWNRGLALAGFNAKAVLALRDPLEVVRSLGARNNLGPAYCALMWLRHVLDAEHASRSMPRSFIFYDALLADWQGEMRRLGSELAVRWPNSIEAATPDVSNFLCVSLRRQHGSSSGPSAEATESLRWARNVYTRMQTLASTRAEAQAQALRSQLDADRSKLDAFGQMFGQPIEEFRSRWNQATRLHQEVEATRVGQTDGDNHPSADEHVATGRLAAPRPRISE